MLLGRVVVGIESWTGHSLFKKSLEKITILKSKLISRNWVPVEMHPKGVFPLRLNFMKLTWSLNIKILLKDRGKKIGLSQDSNSEAEHQSRAFRHGPNDAIHTREKINFSIASQIPFLPVPDTTIYFVFLTKLGETASPSLFWLYGCQLGSGVKSGTLEDCSGDRIWDLSLPF